MMITKVSISGYKSIKSVGLPDLGTINILMGANNSGKSAILEGIAKFGEISGTVGYKGIQQENMYLRNESNIHLSLVQDKITYYLEMLTNSNHKFRWMNHESHEEQSQQFVSHNINAFINQLQYKMKNKDCNLPFIYYISADRGIWRRQFDIVGQRPISVGINGENAPTFLFYLKENEEEVFTTLREFIEKLGIDVNTISNYIPHTGRAAITRFIDPQTGLSINLADSGFGANQLLPLIVQTFVAEEDALLLFEEPEISLHPAVQRTFLEAFTGLLVEQKKQAIITSHSVYFIDTIRRWIKEKNPILHNIRLYAITREKGETRARMVEWKELVDSEKRDQIPPELRDFFAR